MPLPNARCTAAIQLPEKHAPYLSFYRVSPDTSPGEVLPDSDVVARGELFLILLVGRDLEVDLCLEGHCEVDYVLGLDHGAVRVRQLALPLSNSTVQ